MNNTISLYQKNHINKSTCKPGFKGKTSPVKSSTTSKRSSNAGAAIGGLGVYYTVKYGTHNSLLNLFLKPLDKVNNSIDIPLNKCKEITGKILHKHNLKNIVKPVFINKANVQKAQKELNLTKSLKDYIKNSNSITTDQKLSIKEVYSGALNKVFRYILKRENHKITNSINEALDGNNGLYQAFSKHAVAPESKPFVMFHELGHAISLKSAGIFKILTKIYPAKIAPIAILATGLMHNKKQKENKAFPEKTEDFINNNAGILTFSAFVPTLIEEAKASINGIKEVKSHLSKETIKPLKKSLRLAFGTHLTTALVMTGAVKLAVIVSDKLKSKQ